MIAYCRHSRQSRKSRLSERQRARHVSRFRPLGQRGVRVDGQIVEQQAADRPIEGQATVQVDSVPVREAAEPSTSMPEKRNRPSPPQLLIAMVEFGSVPVNRQRRRQRLLNDLPVTIPSDRDSDRCPVAVRNRSRLRIGSENRAVRHLTVLGPRATGSAASNSTRLSNVSKRTVEQGFAAASDPTWRRLPPRPRFVGMLELLSVGRIRAP